MGTFLEEVISPIPSLLVLIPAGALVKVQQLPLWHIGLLAVICGFARVLGGSILYWLAHRLEQIILRQRPIFGLGHADIIRFSRRLGDQSKAGRVWIILFALHSLPVFPGTLLSAGAGFIKIPYRIFASATFFGSIVNAISYLALGYMGVEAAHYLDQLGWLTNLISILLVVAIALWLIWRYRKHHAKS